jgi:sulfotransferase family protein
LVAYEVQDVTLHQEGLDALRGFVLETPQAHSMANVHVLHVIGWVVALEVPARAVEVVYHDRVIRTAPVRGTRDDVAEYVGEVPPGPDCAFHCLIGLVGLKPEPELSLRIVLEDGTRIPVATIAIRRGRVETSFEPSLQPLMLTCLGRTGSTWMMKLFTSHPQILVYRRFPYESAPAKYWLHMLKVLSEPANLVESAYPDDFHNNLWWVGQNPFYDESVFEQPALANWFARGYVERLATFTQQTIEDWYMTLSRNQLQPAPVYFAEKHMWPNYLPVLTWELYPRAKEVFLVRDFRDMACSILAFDRKRGFAGFGRPDGSTDEQYIRSELRQMALDLRKSWRTRGERGHLVRYEDLVYQPEETLTGVLDYLELDSSPETVRSMLGLGAEPAPALIGASQDPGMVDAHRTTEDLKESIGRWRRERDPLVRALCEEVFSDVLDDFGYAESGYVPA